MVYRSGMTETPNTKTRRGAGWIIAAVIVYAFALYGVVRLIAPDRTGYEVIGVLLWAAVGTALLLRGLSLRR